MRCVSDGAGNHKITAVNHTETPHNIQITIKYIFILLQSFSIITINKMRLGRCIKLQLHQNVFLFNSRDDKLLSEIVNSWSDIMDCEFFLFYLNLIHLTRWRIFDVRLCGLKGWWLSMHMTISKSYIQLNDT